MYENIKFIIKNNNANEVYESLPEDSLFIVRATRKGDIDFGRGLLSTGFKNGASTRVFYKYNSIYEVEDFLYIEIVKYLGKK